MPRKEDWEVEMKDALRPPLWSVVPPRRLVKVRSIEKPIEKMVSGYVTVEHSLIGRTPRQLEADLGLPAGHLANGCRVYCLARQPRLAEIAYELTLDYPDGLPFDENEARHREILRENHPSLRQIIRENGDLPYPPSKTVIYPPGRKHIHQWRLKVQISANVVCDLLTNESYPQFDLRKPKRP